MKTKEIILLVGPPGSGKSTYSKKYEALGYVRISADKDGKVHKQIFNKAIQNRDNIIVDKMNFNKNVRREWLNAAKEAKYHTTIIVLHENYDTCLQRCLARKGHETVKTEKDAKDALHFFFTKYERVCDDEADTVERVWPTPQYTDFKAIIVDIDGTVADCTHRQHHVQNGNKNWKKFNETMHLDPVNKPIDMIVKTFTPTHIIVFCSGRGEENREVTEKWLTDNGFSYNNLFMRRIKDYRRDDVVKEVILDFEIFTRYYVDFCIDDRPSVCRMWRKHGIRVLQVDDKEF